MIIRADSVWNKVGGNIFPLIFTYLYDNEIWPLFFVCKRFYYGLKSE
jgi:hypothetical protein